MSAWQGLKRALSLLTSRDRARLRLAVVAQALVSLLDVAGVLTLGLVAAMATSLATGDPPPLATGLLAKLGFSGPTSVQQLVPLAVLAGAVLILKSVISLLLTRRTFRFLANRQAEIAGLLAERLFSRSLIELQSRPSQETAYALSYGVGAITLGIVGQSVVVASEVSVVVALAMGLLLVDPAITVFTIAFFGGVALVLQRTVGGWANRLGARQYELDVASVASIQGGIRTYREILVTDRRGTFVDRFRGIRGESAKVNADTYVIYQISKYIFEISLILGAGIVTLIVAATRDAAATAASVTVFLAAASRVFPSLLRMQAAMVNIRNSMGIAQPTFRLFEELVSGPRPEEELAASSSAVEPSALRAEKTAFVGSVEIRDVDFTYPEATERTLEGISLNVPSGSTVALVGSTGAGKSTLADVVLGVLEPDSGHVLVSGVPTREAISIWPGSIACVPQDVALIDGTVLENVALGIPSPLVDRDQVWKVLNAVELDDLLGHQRAGLETTVGEHGVRLSGGQRQRIGIARALYSNPRLIVLDEATSALDADTERAITQALEGLSGEVTLVIVAHRLATVRKCDLVVYLEKGRIRARGSFEDVRALVPDFDRQAQLLGL